MVLWPSVYLYMSVASLASLSSFMHKPETGHIYTYFVPLVMLTYSMRPLSCDPMNCVTSRQGKRFFSGV